jgi:DNA-binding cell septation regulator SpoVG
MARPLITKIDMRLITKDGSKIKASGSMIIGDEILRINFTLVSGSNGDVFVSLPGNMGKDKEGKPKWFSSVYFINEARRKEMTAAVLAKYDELLNVDRCPPASSGDEQDQDW